MSAATLMIDLVHRTWNPRRVPVHLQATTRFPALRFQEQALAVTVDDDSDSHFYSGFAGDLADGGLFVATHDPAPLGARVTLRVTLPSGTHVVEGVVRWQRPVEAVAGAQWPGMGVELTAMDGRAEGAFNAHMHAHTPEFFVA